MTNAAYDHIYLSPHLDDAVLSCGGTIYMQVRRGQRVLVISFFAASPPDDDFNAYTLELKERWGGADDPVAVRRSEDLAALALLGAEALHLPFLDCVYRRNADTGEVYYPTVDHIFGEIHPEEARLADDLLEALVARIHDLAGASLYAPLTVGHHVDHLLVQRVALELQRQGHAVRLYEDFPYAGKTEAMREALQRLPEDNWCKETAYFDEEALTAKGNAVARYVSQLSTFWANTAEMRAALRDQAILVGGDQFGENFWHPVAKQSTEER